MSVYSHFEAILEMLRAMPASKAKENALARLEECSFWTSAAITGIDSPIAYTSDPEAARLVAKKRKS